MGAPTGKPDLFDQILAQKDGLFRSIARRYASPNEAVDLYQEILFQLLKSRDGLEARSDPESWACRIALNRAITYRRNTFRRNRTWQAYRQNVQFEQRGGRGEEQILQEFVESLPAKDRDIFTLYLTELSYAEIAALDGISEPALRMKISRIKDQFEQRYL